MARVTRPGVAKRSRRPGLSQPRAPSLRRWCRRVASRPLTACPWMPALAPRRHHPAPEGQQAHRRLPPGPLLQGLALPRRPAAEAPGDRAAGAEDPGRPVGAAARGGRAGGAHGGGQVCGASETLAAVGALGSSPHLGADRCAAPPRCCRVSGARGPLLTRVTPRRGGGSPAAAPGLPLSLGPFGRLCDRQACMCVDLECMTEGKK